MNGAYCRGFDEGGEDMPSYPSPLELAEAMRREQLNPVAEFKHRGVRPERNEGKPANKATQMGTSTHRAGKELVPGTVVKREEAQFAVQGGLCWFRPHATNESSA